MSTTAPQPGTALHARTVRADPGGRHLGRRPARARRGGRLLLLRAEGGPMTTILEACGAVERRPSALWLRWHGPPTAAVLASRALLGQVFRREVEPRSHVPNGMPVAATL